MERFLLSLVVPCYNEQDSLPLFYAECQRVISCLQEEFPINVEYVFVNDGSSDGTLDELRRLNKLDSNVHYISFSRNFGKESGLYAGIRAAKGDYVATLDADLQDPPSLLPQMLTFLQKNTDYNCVATRRISRVGEPPVRSFFAKIFYKIINKISETEIVDGARDFRLMTRKFVDAVLSLSEVNRFSKGIFSWVGFKTYWISYDNIERVAGKTKWNFWSLFKYSLEGIVGFSTAPLVLSSFLGIICCAFAFIGVIFVFVRAICFGDPVAGWPSIVCVILFIGGLQLFCLGILGQYLAKTYLETKQRPICIIEEKR
ncbi:glycosyltransferase family 2 protein [Bifidobacterium pullorum]|uniref:glycosyltransferase family 2 protein n=1 Tax=Bifidobacterium pullorum TaxID=78448 RepID=UPI002942E875|nr:glycosyltransferase family 2 protein [Bifidobacterium pullorum]